MREYKYGKINELNNNLSENGVDETVRKRIMESGELVKNSDSFEEKAAWFYNAMNVMDELIADNNLKQNIREGCACVLGGWRHKFFKEVNKKYSTTEERIKAVNDEHHILGHEIKIEGKGRYIIYFWEEPLTEPKCSCFGKIKFDKEWSETYCYCCGGHVKHHLQTVLGKKVKVKIVSSLLCSQGEKNCIFELVEI
jgi:hypothetical protein